MRGISCRPFYLVPLSAEISYTLSHSALRPPPAPVPKSRLAAAWGAKESLLLSRWLQGWAWRESAGSSSSSGEYSDSLISDSNLELVRGAVRGLLAQLGADLRGSCQVCADAAHASLSAVAACGGGGERGGGIRFGQSLQAEIVTSSGRRVRVTGCAGVVLANGALVELKAVESLTEENLLHLAVLGWLLNQSDPAGAAAPRCSTCARARQWR